MIWGRGYAVSYVYDVNGKVTRITYPSGRIVRFARDTDGQVLNVTMKSDTGAPVQNIATSVTFAPFGPLTGFTYGNGYALTRTYDQNYWMTGIQVANGGTTAFNLGFLYYNDGRLAEVDDNAASGRTTYISYTPSGRLNFTSGPWGQEQYAYDAAGNRTGDYLTVGGTTTVNNEVTWGNANRLANIQDTNSNITRSFGWTLGGDISSDTKTGGDAYIYYYNYLKRLVSVSKNGTQAGLTSYDYLDRPGGARGGRDCHRAPLRSRRPPAGRVRRRHRQRAEGVRLARRDAGGGDRLHLRHGHDPLHHHRPPERTATADRRLRHRWNAYVNPWGWAQTFLSASASIPTCGCQASGPSSRPTASARTTTATTTPPSAATSRPTRSASKPDQTSSATPATIRSTQRTRQGLCVGVLLPVCVGAAIGGGGNLLWQLDHNGWNIGCVNWSQVGNWTLAGAAFGLGGRAATATQATCSLAKLQLLGAVAEGGADAAAGGAAAAVIGSDAGAGQPATVSN